MATIIKSIKVLTQDEMAIIIQDMVAAKELILVTHDSKDDIQIVVTGYHNPTLAIEDLAGAQDYMTRTITRPDHH